MEITERLVQLDNYCDRTPVISTVSSIVNLFIKAVIIPQLSQNSILTNRYLYHISQKDTSRSLTLLIPGFGNLYVWKGDRKNKKDGEEWFAKSKTEKDLNQKICLMQNASHVGNLEATYALGKFFTQSHTEKKITRGEGVTSTETLTCERNVEEARLWLGKAACLGHVGAMEELSLLQYESNEYEKTLYWARLALEKGSTKALIGLGLCYWYGHGVAKDEDLALKYLEKARANEPEASFNLGVAYYEKNSLKALHYWIDAAGRGYPQACFRLSECYSTGWKSLEKDLMLAESYKKRGQALQEKTDLGEI